MPVIPALREAEAGGSPEVKILRPAWSTWQNPVSTKNMKISWVWWPTPVVPATWEVEAECHLNLEDRGCSELRSRHCTPAWAARVKFHQKKKSSGLGWGPGMNIFTISPNYVHLYENLRISVI